MKKISNLLIILGIIVVLTPIAGSIYKHYQQEKLYNEYLNNPELTNSIEEMDNAFTESTSPSAVTPTAVKVNTYKPTVLGRVKIPSASINLLMVEGTTSKDLNWGAGHVTSTPMPGEIGNCAIAGHRNYTFGSYFSRLGEVKQDDVITVEYKKTAYNYKVYEILTVQPDDSSVLGQTSEDSILTLITCHPKGSNKQRLIIHAKLVS